MKKRKKISLSITFIGLVVVLGALAWFFTGVFEGKEPDVSIKPMPEFFSKNQKFMVSAVDRQRGLRKVKVVAKQAGREITLLKKEFTYKGLLNRDGVQSFQKEFLLDTSKVKLAQGRVDIEIEVRDFSRRNGGDGNLALLQHKLIVDTISPSIRAVSKMHYLNRGGTGLVVYQSSSDAVESGVYLNDMFFKGFPSDKGSEGGLHVCYFGIPQNLERDPKLYLWAKDRAGNISQSGFYYKIKDKRFPEKRMKISDSFIEKVLTCFSSHKFKKDASNVEKFLEINRNIRKENNTTYYGLRNKTDTRRLWEGTWVRLKNAATMAGFGDIRNYYYKGKKIDEQIHLGVDLASLANSEVQAANSGKVLFAGKLGIYGNTVVIDHGQGIASVYGHLSAVNVSEGDTISRGDMLGLTGDTGLAGGDHLHFGIMVGGVFVNPIEFWDSHWIKDNITRKLAMLEK